MVYVIMCRNIEDLGVVEIKRQNPAARAPARFCAVVAPSGALSGGVVPGAWAMHDVVGLVYG